MRREIDIEAFVGRMKLNAMNGQYFYGREGHEELLPYTGILPMGEYEVTIIFSRDVGHHTGGWFKNPDYERCFHLSLSFSGSDGGMLSTSRRIERAPQIHALAEKLCRLFYGHDVKYIWAEPPFSKLGKQYQVWHYRAFCDEHWKPIKPRGEVYTREFTEKGWKSFSDLYGHKPDTATTID